MIIKRISRYCEKKIYAEGEVQIKHQQDNE